MCWQLARIASESNYVTSEGIPLRFRSGRPSLRNRRFKRSKLSSAVYSRFGKAICSRDITIPLSISSYMQDLSDGPSVSLPRARTISAFVLVVPSGFISCRPFYNVRPCPCQCRCSFLSPPSLLPFPFGNCKYFFLSRCTVEISFCSLALQPSRSGTISLFPRHISRAKLYLDNLNSSWWTIRLERHDYHHHVRVHHHDVTNRIQASSLETSVENLQQTNGYPENIDTNRYFNF